MARWSPYSDNGGTTIAIAGEDFVVIASDTRLSEGYSILTRHQSKLFKLSEKTVLGSTGCWGDVLTLTKNLEAKMKIYLHQHLKSMSTKAVAQMLSTMLYQKRFFPYYVTNVLAGLDNEGRGVVYHYDPVGHMEQVEVSCGGASAPLIQSFLDNQVSMYNMQNVEKKRPSRERAISLIKDIFISATEREIHTGDGLIINIISKAGIETQHMELRKD